MIQFRSVTWEDNPLYPDDLKSSVQHVPIKHIISHQETVKKHIVEEYKKKPGKALPTLHKVGKKYYVEDGNHRIVSKIEEGKKTVRARVLEPKELSAILDDLIEFTWAHRFIGQLQGYGAPPEVIRDRLKDRTMRANQLRKAKTMVARPGSIHEQADALRPILPKKYSDLSKPQWDRYYAALKRHKLLEWPRMPNGPRRLSANLDDLIQFASILSIGTAKKIMRGVRAERPGLSRFNLGLDKIRGSGLPPAGGYITPLTAKRKLVEPRKKTGVDLKPHSLVSVRNPIRVVRDMPDMSTLPGLPAVTKRALKNSQSLFRDPLATAVHEHGHMSISPEVDAELEKLGRLTKKNAARQYELRIGEEHRANRDILERIKKHGTLQEAEKWRDLAQTQTKYGYRNQAFHGLANLEATKAERKKPRTLDLGRRVVSKYPWLRRQELSSRIRSIRFNQGHTFHLLGLLDDLIQFQLHQPRPGDERPATLPRFTRGQLVDYTVQEHAARRAGLHRDIRIGTPRHGLLSWATRSRVPEPGQRVPVHQQPTHPHSYLGWEGKIPSGYGAGTVGTADLGKALVTESSPSELHATLADRRGSHRLAFLKHRHGWLLSKGKAPEPPAGAAKPPAKTVRPEQAEEALRSIPAGSIVQPKIDGALVYVSTKGGRPEILSHRVSKLTGKHPVHTERVFKGRPALNIPREHQHNLIGELYGTRGGRAIPPQELGGILNAHLGEAIGKQKRQKVKLKVMPFDVVDGKEPYPSRLQKVKAAVQHLPRDVFHAPEEAHTPGAALRLYHKIRSGRHPLTKEGVIIHPPEGKMVKIKNEEEANVKIHSTFPGGGKFHGSHGGFVYADERGKPLGRVGTGFSNETRKKLHKYIGRTARVRYQEKFPSGRLRAPSFIAVDEGK